MGAAAATNVTSQIHTVGGRDVCRVHVKPSAHPVHAAVTTVAKDGTHQKADRFYVRIGNGTRDITAEEHEIQRYIAGRWDASGL